MSWTMTAMGIAFAALVAAAIIVFARRARSRHMASGSVAAGGRVSLYGLTDEDAARLNRSAREQMRRHQAQWSRDYLPGVTSGALPGRIAGIPRALRVRR